ncbi:MAG: hypothetical protein QXN22_02910 [Thermofilaceae archaeon]
MSSGSSLETTLSKMRKAHSTGVDPRVLLHALIHLCYVPELIVSWITQFE